MTKPKRTVAFISLGCSKNLVDSENLVSTLASRGFRVLQSPEKADLVVVNTCGFLGSARSESIAAIREAVSLKQQGVKAVLVAGCMVGNYRTIIDREAPGVDRLVPFADYASIDRLASELLPDPEPPTFTVDRLRADISLTPGHFAYLKISEGCNHTCSFCVIPAIRGPMQSFPIEDLVARARRLADRGVRELNLIAQDSTVYGVDLYGENRLLRLLERLDRIEGLRWVRLLYAYPTEVRPPLMDLLGAGQRVLPYLDVPIQHVADDVLRRMRRGYGRRDLERMVDGLRQRAPHIALRTTVIIGFPGETEADFEQLLAFVRDVRFDRLGAFRYSREPGSAAADLDGQVSDAAREDRWHRLLALQQEIAFSANRERVGTRETVLVDSAAAGGRPAMARSRRDAPEVDAGVLLPDAAVRPGDFVDVEITGAPGYDLEGRVVVHTPEAPEV